MLLQLGLLGPGGVDPTTLTPAGVYELAFKVIQIALGIIGAIAFIYIVIGGIQYITAGGNEANQAQAKKTIQFAILGFVVAIAAFTLVNFLLQEFPLPTSIETDSPELQKLRELRNN